MYRALILAASLLMTSEVYGASDIYEVDFPPMAVRPIVAAKCEGLGLPCRSDWASLLTPQFRPFKWAQSVFRFPKAPVHMHNAFAFVETPFVEHGEDDYNRLQQMIGQTGPSAERLWAYPGDLGFQSTTFETQYRVVRADIHSTKVVEAIALCVFPVLKGNTAAPDRCDLLAFSIEDRKFLVSSVGFDIGRTDGISAPHYISKNRYESGVNNYDQKAEILKSRHQLESLFDKFVSVRIEKSSLFKDAIATEQQNDFTTSDKNTSAKIYLVLKHGVSDRISGQTYLQTFHLNFVLETGENWSAEMADGTDREGVMLRGGKQDWMVYTNWEARTVVGIPPVNSGDTRVFAFRDPQATGIDVMGEIRTALREAMRDICAPLAVSEESSSLRCLGK